MRVKGEQPCWTCAKACGKNGKWCSWSRDLIPVKGWEAVPSTVRKKEKSYRILYCPEYEEE